MKKSGCCQFLLMFSGFLLSINCYPQGTSIEKWSGTLKLEGRKKESVTFQVKISDEWPYILGMTYADTLFEFNQQRFEEEALIFTWAPGNSDATCHLKKQGENEYKGQCRIKDSENIKVMQIILLEKITPALDNEGERLIVDTHKIN